MLKKVKNSIGVLVLFFSVLIYFVAIWVKKTFGNVTFNEILFHLNVPLDGSDNSFVFSFILTVLLPSLVITIILVVITFIKYKNALIFKINFRGKLKEIQLFPFKPKFNAFIIIIFLIASLYYSLERLDIIDYIKVATHKSTFIEDHYVDPKSVNITFPDKKRNLIYIFLESMEATYADEESGGVFSENLIPQLTKFANENVSFSNTDKIGGALSTANATWTVGAMVSYSAGIPLNISIDGSSYRPTGDFLPGATTIGDILEDNGYNNELLIGSEATFGGRDKLYTTHGNHQIFDWNYALKTGLKKEEDHVWWGFEDYDLFTYAKDELTRLSKEGKPFNLTMLTVDTHFEDGYLSEHCPLKFFDTYSDVIHCSDGYVSAFINWVQQQPYYENTTIVLVGDHLTMDTDFYAAYDENIVRTTYNAIINGALTTENNKNRQFMTYDLFPTVIASLGGTFEGDRLGLGTNLFSDKKTLTEEYGFDTVTKELLSKSEFYDKNILKEEG